MSCECPTWGERIDHVLDGELSPEEEALFRGHLAGCDICRRELEQERQLRESLATLPELPCPPRVAQRIEAATGVASQPGFAPAQGHRSGRWSGQWSSRWSSRWARMAVGLTAAAAVLLAVIVYAPPPRQERTALTHADSETTLGPSDRADDPAASRYTSEYTSEYTSAEILAARKQAHYSLRLTARIISHSERKVVGSILDERIPAAIRGSLKSAAQLSQGGQG